MFKGVLLSIIAILFLSSCQNVSGVPVKTENPPPQNGANDITRPGTRAHTLLNEISLGSFEAHMFLRLALTRYLDLKIVKLPKGSEQSSTGYNWKYTDETSTGYVRRDGDLKLLNNKIVLKDRFDIKDNGRITGFTIRSTIDEIENHSTSETTILSGVLQYVIYLDDQDEPVFTFSTTEEFFFIVEKKETEYSLHLDDLSFSTKAMSGKDHVTLETKSGDEVVYTKPCFLPALKIDRARFNMDVRGETLFKNKPVEFLIDEAAVRYRVGDERPGFTHRGCS